MPRSNSGPFHATESDLPKARVYLASQGIDYTGSSPQQAQRLANKVFQQVRAGLAPSRTAARGHAATPEHPGRAPRQRLATATPQRAPSEAPLRVGTPQEYAAVGSRHNTYAQMPNGVEIYGTSSERRLSSIIGFSADAANDGQGGRIDIEVTYADGTKQTLFTGADHKRNGTHAIDAATLRERVADFDGDLGDYLEYVIEDSGSEVGPAGSGGIVSYAVTFYPY